MINKDMVLSGKALKEAGISSQAVNQMLDHGLGVTEVSIARDGILPWLGIHLGRFIGVIESGDPRFLVIPPRTDAVVVDRIRLHPLGQTDILLAEGARRRRENQITPSRPVKPGRVAFKCPFFEKATTWNVMNTRAYDFESGYQADINGVGTNIPFEVSAFGRLENPVTARQNWGTDERTEEIVRTVATDTALGIVNADQKFASYIDKVITQAQAAGIMPTNQLTVLFNNSMAPAIKEQVRSVTGINLDLNTIKVDPKYSVALGKLTEANIAAQNIVIRGQALGVQVRSVTDGILASPALGNILQMLFESLTTASTARLEEAAKRGAQLALTQGNQSRNP